MGKLTYVQERNALSEIQSLSLTLSFPLVFPNLLLYSDHPRIPVRIRISAVSSGIKVIEFLLALFGLAKTQHTGVE